MDRRFRRSIVWLRRDLRLRDNVALERACDASERVALVFVADPQVLESPRTGAPLARAFFEALTALRAELCERGSNLVVLEGEPATEIVSFARRVDAAAVFYNEDYEPFARIRDARAERIFSQAGLASFASLDHVCYGSGEIEQSGGETYRVFTAYRNKWLKRFYTRPRAPSQSLQKLLRKALPAEEMAAPGALTAFAGYASPGDSVQCSEEVARGLLLRFTREGGPLERYARERDYPWLDGTSRLSVHLRAGTIGIRTCIFAARDSSAWLDELIWREFFQMILARFPHVADGPFLEAGNRIRWRNAPGDFAAWCEGRTGYAIVDAAMHQLNETGWMHNRLRMVSASFLVKHLLVDWRKGERYFEQRLADADLAQNNGGWQWCASTGADAVPYFRIFNPYIQAQKFDADGIFRRRYLPSDYREAPIVEHAFARRRALDVYARAFRG